MQSWQEQDKSAQRLSEKLTMSPSRMLHLARGIEDDHYWVVEEVDGVLIESPWRIEHEHDGYRLSHADNHAMTQSVYALGAFSRPDDALGALKANLRP